VNHICRCKGGGKHYLYKQADRIDSKNGGKEATAIGKQTAMKNLLPRKNHIIMLGQGKEVQ
jgi:hypothetical protein